MDSKGALTIFDTPGKNCPLNILTPMVTSSLQIVAWGGQFSRLSNKITFFSHGKRIGEPYSFLGCERRSY